MLKIKHLKKLYSTEHKKMKQQRKCRLGTASNNYLGFRSRKENPQKPIQLSSRYQPRHLVGNRTAEKDTIIDITSDNQVNSSFPYRWSPACLTFNNYFYLCLYLYITCITINNNAPHLKSPKNQNRRAALGRPAIKITRGLKLVCGRPTLALVLLWFSRKNNYEQQKQNE